MSRRQRARAQRSEAMWRTRFARATTPHEQAKTWYDRIRADVENLPPPARAGGWTLLLDTLRQLHDEIAGGDERAASVWKRLVDATTAPKQRTWEAWRRTWVAINRQPAADRDQWWDQVAAAIAATQPRIVTLRNVHAGREFTTGRGSSTGPTRPRVRAHVTRAREYTPPGREFTPSVTDGDRRGWW